MMSQSLPPTVQDAEKADLCPEVLRICCNLLQGFRGRSEQQTVHLTLVLEGQGSQRLWQSKHDMEILALQEFALTLFQPLGSGQGLAFGAMPIGAGVIGVAFVPALVTALQMAAEGGRATQFDGTQYTLLPSGQRCSVRVAELVAMRTYNIGYFEGRPHGRGAAYCCGGVTGAGSRSRGLVVAQTFVWPDEGNER